MNLLRSFQKRRHYLRSVICDPGNLFLTTEHLLQASKRHPEKEIMADRLAEVQTFYQLTDAQTAVLLADCRAHDHQEDLVINPAFDADHVLFDYYRNHALKASVSHMGASVQYYPIATKLLKVLNAQFPRWRRHHVIVLDYGCGEADYALAFALQGYRVKIADIEGASIDFATWRFQERGLSCDSIAIHESNLYPDLGRNDIIIAGEVLEHIRDPLKLVNNMTASLPKGGYLWTSGFPVLEREVGADHLPEAAVLRPQVLMHLYEHYVPVTMPPLPGFLFKKG